jgi:uncharacterized iron-regulated membrane protein
MVGYLLIVVLSVAVGVVVYQASGRVSLPDEGPEGWTGAAPREREAPPSPPTNFERLSISRVRRSWHDRMIGILGLVVSVAIGTVALTGGLYLLGRMVIALLEKAASPAT